MRFKPRVSDTDSRLATTVALPNMAPPNVAPPNVAPPNVAPPGALAKPVAPRLVAFSRKAFSLRAASDLRHSPSRQKLAGFVPLPEFDLPHIEGYRIVGERSVPIAKTVLGFRDICGSLRVRWGRGRANYRVLPGLYAAGSPESRSPVLVSANYKLSFDALRKELPGIDAWILVLDTKGVNVWCAAGKGSFGTEELISKIEALSLPDIVSHKLLVLPQLGAPGVSAPEVARRTGFRVAWGPVRAADIGAYLKAGMKKDASMRRVEFGLFERLAVAPVELVQSLPLMGIACALSIIGAALGGLFAMRDSAEVGGFVSRLVSLALPLTGGVLVGTLAFPALLPLLPTRSFAIKGAMLGALWGGLSSFFFDSSLAAVAGNALACAAIVSYLGLNFTGCTTFTSQTGAKLEVERGMVPIVAGFVAGFGLRLAAFIFATGSQG